MKELSFSQALEQLKGYKIRIFLNSTRTIVGILLDVKEDHIVLQLDDKIFYFAYDQIHAITKNAKNISPQTSLLSHENKKSLLNLLYDFKYSWITIQSINNQLFVGLLSQITEDYVMLLNEDDQIYIQRSFIVGIYNGIYNENESTLSDSSNLSAESPISNEEVHDEKDNAKKEEKESLHVINHIPAIEQKEDIQAKDYIEHKDDKDLPLTNNQSPQFQILEEEIIHVKDNDVVEDNQSQYLMDNTPAHNLIRKEDNDNEKNIATQEAVSFPESLSFPNITDTSSSSTSNDTINELYAASRDKETVTNYNANPFINLISDSKLENPILTINQEAAIDPDTHYQSENGGYDDSSTIKDFSKPAIEKAPLENAKRKNYSSIPKMEMAPGYISHPLNELGRLYNCKNKKKNKKTKLTSGTKKNVKPVETNEKNLDPIEQNFLLEKQYYSLMKHAEYMYKKLRNERLKK
ncbi:DUF2642 domain-containing protein [Niallia circulans]|uniref:DUF2642 domain-containing protein n=1 Tax=Niallia circulans TaxID=1397 RepID=UPI002E23F481|nr:DUF2642 domain-containing protein [Niallia circulans]